MENLIKDKDLSIEIAGYARISVDTELDKDNSSIENQYSFIEDFAKTHFPNCKLTLYNDRDRSGYTFDQREHYQELRLRLMSGEVKILIVKDFSRFSRRNSLGLYELELLRDAGVRIISITDNIDYPNNDDWLQIQLKFLLNEQPVTDASKKVKAVVKNKQAKGEWLCAVPYGYVITNYKKQLFEVVPDEAEVIREIFKLYNEGWGYKKIANYLTDQKIPTPRMKEKERAEAAGNDYKVKSKTSWSIITVSGILSNDFYIGTFRQHKYQRKKINGTDEKVNAEDNIIFEKHHEAIVDDRTFLYTQEQLKLRSKTNYRGVKKYRTDYSGILSCGDCGSPMFSYSRPDMAPSYMCGTYHQRGKKGCSAHYIRVDFLDNVLKDYLRLVKLNSADILNDLEKSIAVESTAVKENNNIVELLQNKLADAKEELKATKKRKIKDIMKRPEDETIIEETYNEIEQELANRIYGLENQIQHNLDKRNSIIEINRAAKTVFEVFDNILNKERLDKMDICLIVDKIIVYENNIVEIKLKADIEQLLNTGTLPSEEIALNFNLDSIDITSKTAIYTQRVRNQRPKVYTVNVVNDGDPLEIFVDHDGEVILKKYSPIGELGEFAQEYADSLYEATGYITLITDRDQVIAVAGGSKKEYLNKSIGTAAEKVMEERKAVTVSDTGIHALFRGSSDNGIERTLHTQIMAPIIAEGDPIGMVIIAGKESSAKLGELELKLAETAASFLAKQMEQ